MLLYELLLGGTKTPTVTFPTTSTDGVPFSWSISGGQPNEGYWLTTNAADHLTYGSSSSYYGTLDANGNATITGFDFSPNTGTVTVNFIFQYSNNVTKQIVVSAGPAPTVTFPTTQVAAYTFSWSISGGVAGNAYWITTTAPNHLTYGSKASPYGYLDGSGNATITGFSMAGDIGTYSVTFYFYNASTVTKSITLTRTPVDVTAYRFNSVVNNGSTFVAVGENGLIFRSTDSGVTWIQMTSGVTTQLRRVRYFNGYFIAVGAGAFLYSSDGVTWTRNTNFTSAWDLYGVYYFNTRYWVCGSQSNGGLPYLAYFTSLSATSFSQPTAYSMITAGYTGVIITDITSSGTYFHAVTNKAQGIYNGYEGYGSSGGSTWYIMTYSAGSTSRPLKFNSFAYGDGYGRFAVGDNDNKTYSLFSDTITQSTYDAISTGYLNDMVSIGVTTYIAVGQAGKIYYIHYPISSAHSDAATNYTLGSLGKDLYGIAGNDTNGYVSVGSAGCFIYASAYSSTWTAGSTYI